MLRTTYVYARLDPDEADASAYLEDARDALMSGACESRTFYDRVPAFVSAMARPVFGGLVREMGERADLCVPRLDALGASPVNVLSTIERLQRQEVRVFCLAIGKCDLTARENRDLLNTLRCGADLQCAVERDRMAERAQAGRPDGTRTGRPPALSEDQQAQVEDALREGESVSSLARRFGCSRQTVMRVRDAAGLKGPLAYRRGWSRIG